MCVFLLKLVKVLIIIEVEWIKMKNLATNWLLDPTFKIRLGHVFLFRKYVDAYCTKSYLVVWEQHGGVSSSLFTTCYCGA